MSNQSSSMSKQIRITGTACAVHYVCLLLLAFALAAGAGPAHAQTGTNLTGVRILQGTLVAPQSVGGFDGTATSHTNSVTGYTRSPEVIELANGLGASQVLAGTDIPERFRTTLTVQFDSINQKLFTDEIAGQRLQLLGTTQGGNATTTWVDSNGANNFLIPRLLDDLGVAMTSRPKL